MATKTEPRSGIEIAEESYAVTASGSRDLREMDTIARYWRRYADRLFALASEAKYRAMLHTVAQSQDEKSIVAVVRGLIETWRQDGKVTRYLTERDETMLVEACLFAFERGQGSGNARVAASTDELPKKADVNTGSIEPQSTD